MTTECSKIDPSVRTYWIFPFLGAITYSALYKENSCLLPERGNYSWSPDFFFFFDHAACRMFIPQPDWTRASTGSTKSWPMDHQGIPQINYSKVHKSINEILYTIIQDRCNSLSLLLIIIHTSFNPSHWNLIFFNLVSTWARFNQGNH